MSRPITPLALTVLRMLCDGPMHPYEMQQRIRKHGYDHSVKVTHGALYNSVERLAAQGLIEPVKTSREGRRPERTVYRITDAGRDAAHRRLGEILSEPVEEYPLFNAGLAFINLLPADEVDMLLQRRITALEFLLGGHQTAYEALRKRGLERYKLLDMELNIARVRTELDYVRALVDDLAEGRMTWADDERPTTRHQHGDTADEETCQ
ncbi:PadR family transcriptional regulator [Actinomadura sp. NBRC 104425]|uniref:PadR family transcriptional regulator n=1 Tax=Actinomadura sp. NBRC 104425 TaxID=3032204 RepID=UPI0024A061FA|nr:PadR family transcriptional regulator [Actinomadura sp. NBRC 104425]GLZ09918.1 PadR family transcriptional regulator [Actinomadura sp. NBRC 104425]